MGPDVELTIVYSMFANTIFSPQGDHMELDRVFPVDGRPDRAVMETSLYIPKPVETEDEKRHWTRTSHLRSRSLPRRISLPDDRCR
jgi:hypothetical protein